MLTAILIICHAFAPDFNPAGWAYFGTVIFDIVLIEQFFGFKKRSVGNED